MMESVKASQDIWKKLQEEINNTKKSTEEIFDGSGGYIPEVKQATEVNIELLSSFRAAAGGAFALARGVAFMAASTNEDFQKGLRTIAKWQGAFDIFKGGIEVFKASSAAIKTLAASNAALSASQVAVAATSTAAATAMKEFWIAATGPVGIAIASAAAVIGAITAAFYLSIPAADDAATAYTKASEAALRFAKAGQLISAMGRQDQVAGFKAIPDQLANAEKQAGLLSEKMRQSLEAYNRFREMIQEAPDSTTQARAAARQLAAGKDLAAYSAEYRANEADRLGLLNQMAEAETKSLELQKASLDAVREKLDLENARLKSLDAQFGMMSAMDRKELETLAKKQSSGGTLSREELMLLQKVGGSAVNPFVEDRFAEFGRTAGSREAFGAFGVDIGSQKDRAVKQQDAILSALNVGTADEAETAIANRIEEIIKKKNDATKRIVDYLEKLGPGEAELEKRIDKLEEEFKKRRK